MKLTSILERCRLPRVATLLLFTFLAFASTAQVVIVPLTIRCPADQVIWTCDRESGVTFPLPTVIGGCVGAVAECEPPVGSILPLGTTTITCRAFDRCQNTDTCSFRITVRLDTEPPVIDCPPDRTIRVCPSVTGACGGIVNYPSPIASDNSGHVAVTCVPPSGTFFACGSHTVVCRAEDRCGNKTECAFKIEVERGEPPTIQCPPDLTLTTCSNSARLVFPAPVVNPPGTTVTCNPPAGTFLPLGSHAVVCIASNACGTAQCTFKVEVRPIPPPVIRCPTNSILLRIPCNETCVPLSFPPPTVVNGALAFCTPAPGTCLTAGVHTVTCVATNICGDRDVCRFEVRVVQLQEVPPTIHCPTNPIVLRIPCDETCVPLAFPPPIVVNGALAGCTPAPGTCLPAGVHTVTCVATNNCGDRDVCRFEVRVIQLQEVPPTIRCPEDMVVVACSNDCAVVHYPAPVVVNGSLVKCDPPSGSCLPIGVNIVRCYATNACAEAECKFTVTVLPDRRPTLSIKRDGRFVVICWPKTCACYKLQSTRSLNPPIVWTDVDVTPDDSGDSWCVRIPIDQRHRYFRLIKCDQQTAAVYDVIETGVKPAQARELAEALGIPGEQLMLGDGSVRFVNPRKFQVVPTKPINDPAIIDELRRNSQEDEGEIVFEAFDFDAIKRIVPFDGDRAVDLFKRALARAEIGPKPEDPASIGPKPEDPLVRHTTFEAVDANGRPIVEDIQLDTHVLIPFHLGGIPLTGPGSNLRMSFGPDGEPTSLMVSLRKLQHSGEVPVISIDEAARRCAERYPGLGGAIRPRLVYYAPEIQTGLLLPAVQKVLPCYECGGDAPAAGERVSLLQTIIPAVDDPALVPAVQLEASANGNLVNARVVVRGGTPPYRFQWSSSSADLSDFPNDASSIEYNAEPRADERTDTVRVTAIDANGIPVSASKTVEILGGIPGPMIFAAVGGVVDYGTERAVSDMGFGIHSGFNSRMNSGGAFRRFNFTGTSCWERDFLQGGNGLDSTYVDNVDLTFYIGHGSGSGFTFESNQNDGQVHYNDPVGDWGNGDLEWLALTSCQVLKGNHDGKTWAQRWIPAFDGLHMMLGFQTNAHDWDGFGRAFADWMHGRFGVLPPMKMRDAWFLAKASDQPAADIAVAIGVIGPGGCHNVNDYFHGRGPVGPDIRKAQVQGAWRFDFQ